MRVAPLAAEDDFDGWRDAARTLAGARVPAGDVVWQVGAQPVDLFGDEAVLALPAGAPPLRVPRQFLDLAQTVVLHTDPQRWARLYAMLLRLVGNQRLIEDRADPALRALEEMARQVRRDIHKMRAFLRFREVAEPVSASAEEQAASEPRYVAWYEPEHHIVRHNARFFVDRFTTMHWSILTPEVSLHWDAAQLQEGPGATRADAPDGDPVEEVWKTYYASIFNPARLKKGAMLKEMPRKYWKNMPETALVPQLIAGAQARESGMIEKARGEIGGNIEAAWAALREEAMGCTRCHLHKPATQTVFGEGPVAARMMLVGEQPGDQEDLAGKPFVGPAGQVLDRALATAAIDRSIVYVTNAVKHFKFEPRGKRRIHSKPDAGEIDACRWWIEQESAIVKPDVTVALGATAARSLLGRTVTIGRERGRAIALPGGGEGWITVHPSYLLRIPDKAKADEEFGLFVEDLKAAAAQLG